MGRFYFIENWLIIKKKEGIFQLLYNNMKLLSVILI